MANPDFFKAIGSLLSKKGGHLKLAMLLIIPAAAFLDFTDTGYSINAHAKDSSITITPPTNMTPSDEDPEQTESDSEPSAEEDTSD